MGKTRKLTGEKAIQQCVDCWHYSAGGAHPCDPFCSIGRKLYRPKVCIKQRGKDE